MNIKEFQVVEERNTYLSQSGQFSPDVIDELSSYIGTDDECHLLRDSFYPSTFGYTFLLDKPLPWGKFVSVRKVISDAVEREINITMANYDLEEWLEDCIAGDKLEGSDLFLDRYDLSPSVFLQDKDETVVLLINYYANDRSFSFNVEFKKNEFLEGKIKLIGDKLQVDYALKILGKEGISVLCSFFKFVINTAYSRHKTRAEFEEIALFPFTTHNLCGVGPYIDKELYYDDVNDLTFSFNDDKAHCRYLIAMA